MLGKLYHIAAIACIAIVFAGGGLAGYMFAAGKLTPEQIDQIAAVVRDDVDEPEAAAVASEDPNQASGSDENAAASAEELRRRQREDQLQRALGERAYRDRLAQRQLLDQSIQYLLTSEERFERNKKQWQREQQHRQAVTRDEGFDKELEIVKNLPPKIAKDHLIKTWLKSKADAVRLVNGLQKNTIKRILGQMKTPEEMQITHELLEQLGQDNAK